MDKEKEIVVIIPTLNEVENISILVQRIQQLDCVDNIVIVDDGSVDGTLESLRSLQKTYQNLIVFNRSGSKGLGSALRDGFEFTMRNIFFTNLITMDADLSHDPKYIPRLLSSPYDLTVGSRYVLGGKIIGWGLKRKLTSFTGNFLAHSLLSLKVNDVTSGYRSYSRKAVETIIDAADSPGFEFQIQAVEILVESGQTVGEVPIIFTDRINGKSKLKSMQESRTFLKFIIKNLFKIILN